MVATDLAEVAADPPEARRRMDRLVVRQTRRHEIVVAALKETALRSTVRLPAGPPTCVSIVHFVYAFFSFLLYSKATASVPAKCFIYAYTNIIRVFLVKLKKNDIIFPMCRRHAKIIRTFFSPTIGAGCVFHLSKRQTERYG